MKEIKFRAWNRDSKQWIIQLVLRQNGEPMFYHPSENKTISISSLTKPAIDISFYTGLKDKNGKEIYEGDIVKFPAIDLGYRGKWATSVIEEDGGCSYTLRGITPEDNEDSDYNLADMYGTEFNVIGNIYENPELLEAQNGQK